MTKPSRVSIELINVYLFVRFIILIFRYRQKASCFARNGCSPFDLLLILLVHVKAIRVSKDIIFVVATSGNRVHACVSPVLMVLSCTHARFFDIKVCPDRLGWDSDLLERLVTGQWLAWYLTIF